MRLGPLTRLLDLGVPPYLVASTVGAVLAQRGRVSIYELLVLDEGIHGAVTRHATTSEVRALK